MIGYAEALSSARAHAPDRVVVDGSGVQELRQGWYFPFRVPVDEAGMPIMMGGAHGLIVNKHTGACLMLGSGFRVERDLEAYEQGFQFSRYDLTVTRVADESHTLQTLEGIGISAVVPEVAHGVEWRIPRGLTRVELKERLATLPCTFEDVSLYFRVELLLAARANGWFCFELREHRGEEAADHS